MTPLRLIEILSDAGYWVRYSSAQEEDWIGPTENKHVFFICYLDKQAQEMHELRVKIAPAKFAGWRTDEQVNDTHKLLEFVDTHFRNQGFEVG